MGDWFGGGGSSGEDRAAESQSWIENEATPAERRTMSRVWVGEKVRADLKPAVWDEKDDISVFVNWTLVSVRWVSWDEVGLGEGYW